MNTASPFSQIVGIETEYGIQAIAEDASTNPTIGSAQIVDAYAKYHGSPRWDYQGEDPLNDMRGMRIDRRQAHPTQLTDVPLEIAVLPAQISPDGGVATDAPLGAHGRLAPSSRLATNAVTRRGGRLYVDHSHPEVSSPECYGPVQAVLEDAENDRIICEANRLAGNRYRIIKNVADQHGHTWGHHENYRISRSLPWKKIVPILASFLALRPIYCGAGWVRTSSKTRPAGYEISQRARHLECIQGLQTTYRRPLVNARDEPHDHAQQWRRLHIIAGDPNLLAYSTYLRVTSTSLLLWTVASLWETSHLGSLESWLLKDPVKAAHQVAADPHLASTVELMDGRLLPALEVLAQYAKVITQTWQARAAEQLDLQASSVQQAINDWNETLHLLQTDLSQAAMRVEWLAKYQLLDRQRGRWGSGWEDPRLAALDIKWADLDPANSLFEIYRRKMPILAPPVGRGTQRTRGTLRAELMGHPAVVKAGWTTAVLADPQNSRSYRIPLGAADNQQAIIEDGDQHGIDQLTIPQLLAKFARSAIEIEE
ncbi:proteasome accessory factor PafA2 family protein [Boudabousia marimammalium]|uniref:Proteasome accessory factor PafA2 n=1 Tax=Boudabousia marimammalium TaxID=156892 RepID=A0A1Q5PRA7_9ACTO|nr:proteasome accessory factor PafA2 family protein [Boudabousia marimammalium]OKL50043.1 hypothetical protein BM477_03920 [Boudabousia marimammalium]